MARFRTKAISLATGFGAFREGEEFSASEEEAAGMLAAGLVDRVGKAQPAAAMPPQVEIAALPRTERAAQPRRFFRR